MTVSRTSEQYPTSSPGPSAWEAPEGPGDEVQQYQNVLKYLLRFCDSDVEDLTFPTSLKSLILEHLSSANIWNHTLTCFFNQACSLLPTDPYNLFHAFLLFENMACNRWYYFNIPSKRIIWNVWKKLHVWTLTNTFEYLWPWPWLRLSLRSNLL